VIFRHIYNMFYPEIISYIQESRHIVSKFFERCIGFTIKHVHQKLEFTELLVNCINIYKLLNVILFIFLITI